MEFSSLIFIFIFLPIFLVLLFLLKQEAHNFFILLASLAFYSWGEGKFVLLLLVSICVNYLLGLAIDMATRAMVKKTLFIMAIVFNLGMLVYFKYTHFILENLGVSGKMGTIHLPIGISFFTFQALSFIIEVYRKTVPMDKNPLNFALYMALFPKLAMGPITPYRTLSAQIQGSGRAVSAEDFAEGVKRFSFGIGKKVLIADTLAKPANGIFAIPSNELTTPLAWLGIICYTLQIYFDFSGYTDMAIGIARMCGFTFLENFNYPYISRSIKEFWRRWHISLAQWLRDYLFLPIAYATSRRIVKPRVWGIKAENWAYFISASITFLICGIWHGAAWTFFVWGGYYGMLLVIEHAGLGKWIKRRWKPVQLVYCQLLVMIGWVFFRSETISYALGYLKTMAGFGTGDGVRFYTALYLNMEVIIFLIFALAGTFPLFPKLKNEILNRTAHKRSQLSKASEYFLKIGYYVIYNLYLLLILISSVMVITSGTYNPFIYFRF